MIDLFRRSRREALPSTPLLDEINVTTLREDPDLLEKVIVGQHQQAASNESVADLLRSIFLLPDRDADFGRFAKSVELSDVEKFDRVEHRDRSPARDLCYAADIAGRNEIGRCLQDVRDLAIAQPQGNLRLQNIIGAGRAAAQMPFWNIADPETRSRQELLRQGVDLLAMLHRAG